MLCYSIHNLIVIKVFLLVSLAIDMLRYSKTCTCNYILRHFSLLQLCDKPASISILIFISHLMGQQLSSVLLRFYFIVNLLIIQSCFGI